MNCLRSIGVGTGREKMAPEVGAAYSAADRLIEAAVNSQNPVFIPGPTNMPEDLRRA
jgi:hypothetical protein